MAFEQMRANVGKLLRGIDRYQFNPAYFQTSVTAQILLKALTNLPHTDFTLCKCMIDQPHQEERPIRQILYLGNLLETCHFQSFWVSHTHVSGAGLRAACTQINIYREKQTLDTQVKVWMNKYGWTENEEGQIFIFNQEESVKPKNIVEKIDFESVSSIMATSQ
uniref:Eukaryotic translation initiation factor 3, subunit K n=1 Tax=Astyanax mexicanus TaxID=7994 RepID=A0A8B9HCL1_ASTMX